MADTYQQLTLRNNRNNLNLKKNCGRMRNFHFRYLELCRSKNYPPLLEVRAKQNETSILEFFGDKFRIDDWLLIIESLHYDQTLHQIGIRLRKNFGYVLDSLDTDKKARMLKNKPVVFTKFIFNGLVDAITNSIQCNRNLNTLALEALPLSEKYIMAIAKAISTNESLQTISFNRSSLGDKGCEAICSTIKYLLNIENVNMSQCQLTVVGATSIADMIKFQKIYRYTEGWKKSLRYREVNPDTIPGLKTIYLAKNSDIGDKGAELITEILKEDVWIKEIDMSECGLTDIGGKCVLNCLEINKYIQDFKIKSNPDISHLLLTNIRTKLGKEDERDTEKVKKGKISVPKILEKVKLLEEQIVMEKSQRKKVENLNEQLHAQIMCYERKLNDSSEVDLLQEGYVMVKQDSLDMIIKERDDYKNALSAVKFSKARNSNFRKITKIRKAKSETKYIDNIMHRNNNTQSEHTLKGHKVAFSKEKMYVEKTIGDTELNTVGHKNYKLHINKQPNEVSCFFSPAEIPEKESYPSKVNIFKGVEEALRLFVNKKQCQNNQANRQVPNNVRTLFMGKDRSEF